jgi:hypothetical protein
MGGVSELCKVFPIAVVMPHTFCDGPGLLAAIHATATLGMAVATIERRCFDLEAQLYGDMLLDFKGLLELKIAKRFCVRYFTFAELSSAPVNPASGPTSRH